MHRRTLGLLLAAGVVWALSALGQRDPMTEEPLTHGPSLYRAYCASCHGADGAGGGPVAKALHDASPDLTRLAKDNGGRFPRARVERLMRNEEGPAAHGTAKMPVWGPVFAKEADLGPEDADKMQILCGSTVTGDALAELRVGALADYLESIQKK